MEWLFFISGNKELLQSLHWIPGAKITTFIPIQGGEKYAAH
jgi:hypothetical protein